MARVDVSALADDRFQVAVEENGSTSTHQVTATALQVERVAPDADPARVVEASMRFLLDREPKESIMSRFDLDVIARFFPEYWSSIHEYL